MAKPHGVTGSEKAQKILRDRDKVRRLQWEADLVALMKQPAFRRFLWTVIDDPDRCNSHGTGTSWSGSEMYFNAGRRQIGVDLREEAKKISIPLYLQMVEEATKSQAEDLTMREGIAAKATIDDDEEESQLPSGG